MHVHIVEVTVEPNGTVTVKPEQLHVYPENIVSWTETAGKPILLTFEDPEAFRPGVFAVTVAERTCLIANKIGHHRYSVAGLDKDDSPLTDNPQMPVIIIMDPSKPHSGKF